jgi:hypothetical protein
MIQVALSDKGERESILTSNELWGGAGSVADQAGLQSRNREARAQIEKPSYNLVGGSLKMVLLIKERSFGYQHLRQCMPKAYKNKLHRINFRCHLLCMGPHKSRHRKFTR